MKNKLITLVLVSTLGLVGCGSDNDPVPLDIVETAQADDRFETLVAAVVQADLVSTLQGDGPFTVFAPTDDAFASYLQANDLTAQELLNSSSLGDILTYHVLAGEVLSGAAISVAGSSDNLVETVNTADLALSLTGSDLYVNTSKVIVTDVQASNGVIHAIDKVLVPPTANALSDDTKTITELVTALSTASSPEFTELYDAVVAADLAATLDSAGPFTVFAPTDAAFNAIDTSGLTTAELKEILLQHVVSGNVDSVMAYALNGSDVTTANTAGSKVSVLVQDGKLTIEGAEVVITDVQASNGVIHVISSVIVSTD
ncbi:MAG: putative surface protein with fasciclin (FAS1) repeats [Psychrobacter glaciei]|jgi:uncharacterized surface protein with fasciclin (FAS1) repeats